MRLLLASTLHRPDTVERLRALSPDLDVVDAHGDPISISTPYADPEVEVIVGSRAPSDLSNVPRLKWLQVRSAGVDHLTADPPWDKGVIVTNGRGVYAVPIGEYVSGMVLRIFQPSGFWAADQAAHRWRDFAENRLATIVRGKTAVMVGYGSIGREVARQLAALGLRILAVKPRPDVRGDDGYRVPGTGDPDGTIPERIVGVEGLRDVVSEADLLILTMPLTRPRPASLDGPIIAALPQRAWLDRRSRGPLVDEPALIEALQSRRLAGAVLDVFAVEPLPAAGDVGPPNVIITPHVSGATHQFLDDLVIENVRRSSPGNRC